MPLQVSECPFTKKINSTFVYAMEYPVLDVLDSLKQALKTSPVVILQAPPGAGKSTVLPLKLINESWLGDKKIVMLEPRRLAARSVAARMAELLGEPLGDTIGYRIRFEHCVSDKTKIEVVTEGILTRMIQRDITLDDVGLILFDEFHERSLQADLALALSCQIQQELRPDLRLMIMSATLDGEMLSAKLNHAPVITSTGRQYPVTLFYNEPDDEPLYKKVTRAMRKAIIEQRGDMLVFLPGIGDILRVQEAAQTLFPEAVIVPLYGDLSFQKQREAILPNKEGKRKIVLATSIAETSLTIEGITTVIDSGYARVPRFNVRSGLTRLETIRVTRDAADQRAGRAGRLGPGVCYRLWSERTHHHLQPARKPEITEADLASLILELHAWGSTYDLLKWITPPPSGAAQQAIELLEQLGAINNGSITSRGKAMLQLPTHPRIAHMLLEAEQTALLPIACDIAAILEERDPLSKEAGADITLRLQALQRWRRKEPVVADKQVLERIERLSASWRKHFQVKLSEVSVTDTQVGWLLAAAYPERIAQQLAKHSERYKLASGKVVLLQNYDDLIREPWLAIAQLDAGVGEGKIFLAAPVHVNDLITLATEQTVVRWDSDREMLIAQVEQRIGNLVLQSKLLPTIPEPQRLSVLLAVIRDRGLQFIGWDETHAKWQARVMSLHSWRPEESWPDVSDAQLMATLEIWLAPFLIGVTKRTDFKQLNLLNALHAILPWELQARLDALAPLTIQVPSGSQIKIQYYTDGRPPELAVRLQEVFGWFVTPSVNNGRTPIVLQLLSPGFKPVQVTQDLKSFWQTTYAEVRKELRARYPRHSWPEDPYTAEAVRGVKKRTP